MGAGLALLRAAETWAPWHDQVSPAALAPAFGHTLSIPHATVCYGLCQAEGGAVEFEGLQCSCTPICRCALGSLCSCLACTCLFVGSQSSVQLGASCVDGVTGCIWNCWEGWG